MDKAKWRSLTSQALQRVERPTNQAGTRRPQRRFATAVETGARRMTRKASFGSMDASVSPPYICCRGRTSYESRRCGHRDHEISRIRVHPAASAANSGATRRRGCERSEDIVHHGPAMSRCINWRNPSLEPTAPWCFMARPAPARNCSRRGFIARAGARTERSWR